MISQNLTVKNNVPGVNGFSQAKTQEFEVTVVMPDEFRCTGGSTGNVCTVRCRNNAQAGPFGGCFPVEQVDTEPNENTPANIETKLSLEKVFKQVADDKKDLPAAIAAIQDAGSDQALQNAAVVSSILGQTVTSVPAEVQTPDVVLGGNPDATATSGAAVPTESGNAGNGNAGNDNAGNGNAGNGNAGGNGNNNGNGNANGNGNNNNNNNDNTNDNGNNNGNGRGGFGNGFGGNNGFGNGQGNNRNNNRRRASIFRA